MRRPIALLPLIIQSLRLGFDRLLIELQQLDAYPELVLRDSYLRRWLRFLKQLQTCPTYCSYVFYERYHDLGLEYMAFRTTTLSIIYPSWRHIPANQLAT